MSNVKQVSVCTEIPFNWMDDMETEHRAFMASAFLSPTVGLNIHFRETGEMRPNEHGGKTAMVTATIDGSEAVSDKWLERLRAILRQYGEIKSFTYFDIEA